MWKMLIEINYYRMPGKFVLGFTGLEINGILKKEEYTRM